MSERPFDFKHALLVLTGMLKWDELVILREWLPSCGDPENLRALAAQLPTHVASLSNEVSLECSGIAMLLAEYAPPRVEDLEGLPPRLRMHWRRAQLCSGKSTEKLSEACLLEVVSGWELSEMPVPGPLLDIAAHADDARLRYWALQRIARATTNLRLSVSDAFSLCLHLASDEEAAIRSQALMHLHAGWLFGLGERAARQRKTAVEEALMERHPAVVASAVAAALNLGHREALWAIVRDASQALSTRVWIVERAGSLAIEADIDDVFSLCQEDALAFDAPVRSFLLNAHRRGVFLRSRHLKPLLSSFDRCPDWSSEEIVRVSYLARKQLVSEVAAIAPNDLRWGRRSSILSVAYGEEAGDCLAASLNACTDLAVARDLLRAAGACAAFRDVETLLLWLGRLPLEVLPVLRVKGRGAQQAIVEKALSRQIETPTTPSEVRQVALEVFWSLSEDRESALSAWVELLGPSESRLFHFLSFAGQPARALFRTTPAWLPESELEGAPLRWFAGLCETGDVALREQVVEQFRDRFRGYVGQALAGDFKIKREALPQIEQMLFRYGRNLVANGRCVRHWIEASPETGRDFVLAEALQWLRESPSEDVVVALLELIARHAPSGPVLREIEAYWRHGHKGVQRAAIAAILASGEGARGLELSLCRLGESESSRILTQAFAATMQLKASWAEAMVVPGLEHANMSVKKAAADALAAMGTEKSIAKLVFWIGRHGNRGFRTSLKSALHFCTGGHSHVALLAALEEESDLQTIEHLWDALDGLLTLDLVTRLSQLQSPHARAVVDACCEGTIQLQGASRGQLLARLHRIEKRRDKPEKEDVCFELRTKGFSGEAAQRFVEASKTAINPEMLQLVQKGFADWMLWALQRPPCPQTALLLLSAAQSENGEHYSELLDCVARLGKRTPQSAFVQFLERANHAPGLNTRQAQQAISLLKALPSDPLVGGIRWFDVLGKLGAFRSTAELQQALHACEGRKDSGAEMATLLKLALQIPNPSAGEASEVTSLRNEAEYYSETPLAVRESWLATLLKERPLEMALAPALPCVPSRRSVPSALKRRELLAALHGGDERARASAADAIVLWNEKEMVSELLRVYLENGLGVGDLRPLAASLEEWPQEEDQQVRANALMPYLDRLQIRSFLPIWILQWREGKRIEGFSGQCVQEEIYRIVRRELAEGKASTVALLQWQPTLAIRFLFATYSEAFPAEMAHLDGANKSDEKEEGPLGDPIAQLDVVGLSALIFDTGAALGLRVRALHALVAEGEQSKEVLAKAAVDRQAKLRSAGLRGYRQVASKEESCALALQVLQIESRKDIVIRLLQSLGHARYAPAMPELLQRLTHGEYSFRQAAHAALRGWGPSAAADVLHASKRARPDKRAAFVALWEELQE